MNDRLNPARYGTRVVQTLILLTGAMFALAVIGKSAAEELAAGTDRNAGPRDVGVVSHIKVLSDKVQDVSSLDAWKRAFMRPGMTDEEKALAVWESVVRFRHQDAPPNEYLQGDSNVHDPIKTFNVYGYNMCCCATSNIEALARAVGLEARGWSINAHNVPEVFYDGQWHMFDASLQLRVSRRHAELERCRGSQRRGHRPLLRQQRPGLEKD